MLPPQYIRDKNVLLGEENLPTTVVDPYVVWQRAPLESQHHVGSISDINFSVLSLKPRTVLHSVPVALFLLLAALLSEASTVVALLSSTCFRHYTHKTRCYTHNRN